MTYAHRMINDPKSSQFINWMELGTRLASTCLLVLACSHSVCFISFVVTNVGEFSRTILGSHFKHNNVSGFHGAASIHAHYRRSFPVLCDS